MSARILVVDDQPANVTLLAARLQASCFTVLKAYSGAEALRIAAREKPDLVLLDVMMPNMDGFECCRRLKADPETAHVPVVMVTALDQAAERLRGLKAGADDFLTKPVNDMALSARVRSLVRLKMMIDELRMRDGAVCDPAGEAALFPAPGVRPTGRVVIAEPDRERGERMRNALVKRLPVQCRVFQRGAEALADAQRESADLFLISDRLDDRDGLRLCSELRSHRETRWSAVVVTVEDKDFETVAACLDLGASDYVMRPVNENELVTRVCAQLTRKRYADRLRETMHADMRMALTDGLTGLYNRRCADQHLARLLGQSRESGAPLCAMMLDLDRFKRVNDEHGHAAGDKALTEFAKRLQHAVRGVDLVARYGGEEFLVVLPETGLTEAAVVAERVRERVAAMRFDIGDGAGGLDVTVSIGVAEWSAPNETAADLIQRADAALYRSKREGRDRVTLASDTLAERVA